MSDKLLVALDKAMRMSEKHNSPAHILSVRNGYREPDYKVVLSQLLPIKREHAVVETVNPPSFYGVR